MIREYKAGEVVERSQFPVGNAAKPRKRRNKGATSPRKQDQNDRDSVKRLARTINCNFVPGDLWLTMTYSQVRMEKLLSSIEKAGLPATPDNIRASAVHERDLFLRRVKRELNNRGIGFKYIAMTSDVDGDTGELVRVHHHVLIQAAAFETALRHWSREELDIRPLREQKDYTPIALYMSRQVRRQPDGKKYTSSRNLKKPEITETIVYGRRELKAPPGAVMLHRGEYDIESATQYIRYIAPPRRQKRGGKRE